MKVRFNKYKQPEIPLIHLATPDKKILCTLNSIQPDSGSLKESLNNTYELSFTVDRYLDVYGCLIESNGYDLINEFMRVKLEGVGWFILKSPTIENDGKSERKIVLAESAEIELSNHDLTNFKINCGTTDSYEMLVDGNVDIIDDVEFAKKQIVFCDKENPQLSLVHIILSAAEITGWSIGYVDPVPKIYKSYSDGQLVNTAKSLKDEIGTFDISSKGAYAFLTQDVAQFFECICVFDFEKFEINFYRAENLGKDTNVHIGFRNLQKSNRITVDDNSIYTRYRVSGADGLSIEYVNFGNDTIEDVGYYLTTKFMPESLIQKYKKWHDYVESVRVQYIELTRNYNEKLKILSELKDRVPLDDCSTEWYKFTVEDLQIAKDAYVAQLKGYESFYVDENGDFDQTALDNSSDAKDYYQIRDVIIPNIDIAIYNKPLMDDDEKLEYIQSYETDWKLYGLDELSVKLDSYKDRKEILENNGYGKPYTADSTHTRDYHEQCYAEYLDICTQLDETISGTCANEYLLRTQEVQSVEAELENHQTERLLIQKNVQKENWNIDGTDPFTEDELEILNKLYVQTDYVNENMFLVSSDDQVSAIDEQLKLLDAAKTDLESTCQPQYTYTTDLDNFLALYDYKNYIENLNIGDFLYLGVRDDYVVKLRIVSMEYNPFTLDNNLTIEFSNMVKNRSKRNDIAYLLSLNSGSGKNQISGSSNNSSQNEGITLTAGLINKIIASTALGNKVQNILNQNFGSLLGEFIAVKNLNAEMIRVTDIIGENGFFDYLQSKLIAADKIVADSGEFKELKVLLGYIDSLLSGTVSAELGHIIKLTAENVSIDEAVIKDLIAAQILVSDLKAGDITLTNQMRILSENGKLIMNGETMQIMGQRADGTDYVAIQLGYDANNNPSLIICDSNGSVMLDGSGLHEGIIPDGLIKTDMISDGAVTEDKIDKSNIREWTDENGNKVFDISKLYYGDDKFEVTYNQFKQEVINEIPFRLELFSSSGNMFLNGMIDTYLSITLYKGNEDVTAQYPDSCFIWTRQSADADLDDYWNSQHKSGAKSLHITREDIYKKAQFRCSFWLDDEVVATTK